MSQAEDYLKYARECIEAAEKAADERARSALMELARTWTTAAASLGAGPTNGHAYKVEGRHGVRANAD
jgi:hypothetical protein